MPFTWVDVPTKSKRSMEAVGGLLGVAQDRRTLTVRTAVGWAIRERDLLSVLLDRLTAEHDTGPGTDIPRQDRFRQEGLAASAELGQLYKAAGRADLFGTGPAAAYRILPPSEVESADVCPGKRPWLNIVTVQDGGRLAVYAGGLFPIHIPAIRDRPALSQRFADRPGSERLMPVWYQPPRRWLRGRVVALSLPELLRRMLDSDGDLRWLWKDTGYQSAADYMDPR